MNLFSLESLITSGTSILKSLIPNIAQQQTQNSQNAGSPEINYQEFKELLTQTLKENNIISENTPDSEKSTDFEETLSNLEISLLDIINKFLFQQIDKNKNDTIDQEELNEFNNFLKQIYSGKDFLSSETINQIDLKV